MTVASPLPADIETISFGTGRFGPAARAASAACSVTAEMVRPAAVNSGSGSGSAAPAEAAAFACCDVCLPPSSVSIPAGVSSPGGGAPSDALGRTSPSTAPLAATRPASSSGNCQAAAAVPPARGAASAVSRDAVPGVDNGRGRASSDAGTGRAATRRELQPEGQTQPDAFSRICAPMLRQKTVRRAISAKILSRNRQLPYPSLRRDSLSFEKVVSPPRGWHSPCFFFGTWNP